jgi:hypothetical protein
MGFRSMAGSRSASRSQVCNRLELACERRLLSVHTEETKGASLCFVSTIKFLEAMLNSFFVVVKANRADVDHNVQAAVSI